jgi:hypothetical protein
VFKINTKVYKKLEYIVAGTGRCGTVFFSHLLTNMGIPCGHEHIFNYEQKKICFEKLINPKKRKNNFVSAESFASNKFNKNFVDTTKTIAESSCFLVNHFEEHYLNKTPLIHTVKNPFKVIKSLVDKSNYFKEIEKPYDPKLNIYELFIYRNYPEIKQYSNPHDKAARYFISCHEKILLQKEKRKYILIQIEKINEKKEELELFLKKPYPSYLNSKRVEKKNEIDFSTLQDETLKDDLKRIMEKLSYPW